jgi:hypothetical protein
MGVAKPLATHVHPVTLPLLLFAGCVAADGSSRHQKDGRGRKTLVQRREEAIKCKNLLSF